MSFDNLGEPIPIKLSCVSISWNNPLSPIFIKSTTSDDDILTYTYFRYVISFIATLQVYHGELIGR